MFELTLMLGKEQGDVCPLDASSLQEHCRQTLLQQTQLDVAGVTRVEISVQMLDVNAMRSLNHHYRDKDKATNVLSFESGMPVLDDGQAGSLLVLGDIVLCPEIIADEALDQRKSVGQHWVHMLVHGTLHLCGYDHVDPIDASIMENLEIQILSACGFSNPYQIQPVQ